MGQSVRASQQGLAIANQARQRRGWTKTSTARWWQDAHTSRATLRRFWRGERIQQGAFIAICRTVGLEDWQKIADLTHAQPTGSSESLSPEITVTETAAPGVDWGDAPDVEQFYGRDQELQQLQTWILQDNAKLINLNGLGGVGKTALALALAEQLQASFDHVIWRAVPASVETLLTQLLNAPIDTVDQGVRQLLKTMQHRRLIILDTVDETLLSPYLDLIYHLSRARHRSCFLVITRTPLPPQFHTLNRSHQLPMAGLSAAAAARLLATCGCRGQAHHVKKLARIYSHNPLALKLVAATIQTVFSGQIASFLEQDTLLLPDPLRQLFQQQLDTLEPTATTILFWLAIWQEPITLCRLQTHLCNANPADTLTALTTLLQRSLVTQHFPVDQPCFSLPPMVLTFVAETLVTAILAELHQGLEQRTIHAFKLLRTLCLVRPGTDDILGDRILTAVRQRYLNDISQETAQPLSTAVDNWLLQADQGAGYLRVNLTLLRDL